jgi:methyl-accepting chemotaxis protein
MNLRRLRLKTKTAVGLGSLLAIIAAMGLVGYRAAATNEELAEQVQLYSSLKDITRSLQQAILTQRLGARDVLMGRDKETTHLFERGDGEFRQAMNELAPLLPTETARALYARVDRAHTDYSVLNERVIAGYRAGDEATANETFRGHDALSVSNVLAEAMNGLMAEFEHRRQDALDRQVASDRRSKTLLIILAVSGVAFGLAIAAIMAQSIVGGIRGMVRMIESIAANNLAADDMPVECADEMGNAAFGLNKMKNSLRRVILSIASTATEVSGASREISTRALQASVSAENQRQQVQQIAVAMQEMSATVREVSHHAHTAAESAAAAANSARDGGKTVESVLECVRGIAQSARDSAANIDRLGGRSDEIGRIVGVIDEIASQTSLLALNAAIEAVRAGEHGRGFAVVASEVRRLAERTTAATREIADVIQSVQSMTSDAVSQIRSGSVAVEQGMKIAGQAGQSIQRIIGEAEKVGAMVAQIAFSATQQETAANEVAAGMAQINQLAAESADGARLSAGSCERLFNLAVGLQKMVDGFETGKRELARQRPWDGSGELEELRSTSKWVGAGV